MVGIDPAFRQRGFAISVIDEDNTVDFKVFASFLNFMDWAEEARQNSIAPFFCIENSNLQENVFFDKTGTVPERLAKACSVGKNQAASQYTVEYLIKYFGDERVFELSPKQKGAKIETDNRIFAIGKTYGHVFLKKKLNQDERDAYKMAYLGIDNFKKHKKI